MNRLQAAFPRAQHVFLPVIHVETIAGALRNTRIAVQNGADGVFLISHKRGFTHLDLMQCYETVREQFPGLWVGLNCLINRNNAIRSIPIDTAGLWVDNAGINEGPNPTADAETSADVRRASGWQGLYFGGIAFKYQDPVVDVARVSRLAMPFVDVITTSGEGTGKPADVEKIRLMKEAIGDDHPLAIASGTTPENVSEYMPYVNCFLVATGISDSHTELNPERVHALAKALGK